MRRLIWVLVACFGLALSSGGCKHDRAQAVAASYSSVTKPTPFVAPPLTAMGVAAIPVEEEYEERAKADITPENLLAKLAEIEKEVGAWLPSPSLTSQGPAAILPGTHISGGGVRR